MPTDVRELRFTIAAIDKLGARGISEDEVAELLWNSYRTTYNPKSPNPERRFLIGKTNGGRPLTVVIEPTDDPTTWLVVTGWESTPTQRKILEG